MPNEKLKTFFSNPPKGGNGTGVPTFSRMSAPSPPPQNTGIPRDGGLTIRDRRLQRVLDQMSDQEKRDAYMAGMEIGPPPTSGPEAVTSLRASFEAGEGSARHNAQESHKGQTDYNPVNGQFDGRQVEFRNYRRSPDAPQRNIREGETSYYDYEEKSAQPRAGAGSHDVTKRPQPDDNPDPDTSHTTRSDGRRQYPMR